MNNCISAVEVFKFFLENVKKESIPLIALSTREINESISFIEDYNYFLPSKFNNELLSVMFKTVVSNECSFVIKRVNYGKLEINIYNTDDTKRIVIEICNFLSVKDPLNKTLEYIHFENLSPFIFEKNDGKMALDIEVESLYYLSYLYTSNKKVGTPLVNEQLEYYYNRLKGKEIKYAELFEDLINLNTDIKTTAHKANIELTSKKILSLKEPVPFNKKLNDFFFKVLINWNRIKINIFSLMRLTPIMGPDGVVKTTLIEHITSLSKNIKSFRFKKTFRTSPLYKLLIPLLKSKLVNGIKKGNSLGKSVTDDKYGNYVIFNALLVYPLRMLANFVSRDIVFVDRYFYEYLFKDVRNKSGKASFRRDWKVLLFFIPRSLMMIHLDAPNCIILNRKEELEDKGLNLYREGLFKIYLEKPSIIYCYINTNIPSKECNHILENMCNSNLKYFKEIDAI